MPGELPIFLKRKRQQIKLEVKEKDENLRRGNQIIWGDSGSIWTMETWLMKKDCPFQYYRLASFVVESRWGRLYSMAKKSKRSLNRIRQECRIIYSCVKEIKETALLQC